MKTTKKISYSLCIILVMTFLNLNFAFAAKKVSYPEIRFTATPKAEYTVGDRVQFNISAPNYGGKVEYRVILWEDSKKLSHDLWNASNGYPNRYYTKWQPTGKTNFTLGWVINEPGTYRITVYVKRVGVANNKTAQPQFNCDRYIASAPFVVKAKDQVTPPTDNSNNQPPTTPTLPTTPTEPTTPSNPGTVTPPINGGGVIIPPQPPAEISLAVEGAGVALSNGESITGVLNENGDYFVDLTKYDGLIGVKVYITVNKSTNIEISGFKFDLIAHTPRTFGQADFGMKDGTPPGVAIWNLRENYSNSEGIYRETISMKDATGKIVAITIKMKVK